MPVWTMTCSLSSCLIFPIVLMNLRRGTEPSGRHPPLMRHPNAPSCLSLLQRVNNSSGVFAGYIVFRTLPPQCLHFSEQPWPVIEIVGKSFVEER